MAGMEEHVKNMNIKAAMTTLIISAFGFVAALFWRDAIQQAIDVFVPAGDSLMYSFLSAAIVTVIAIIIIIVLSRIENFSISETVGIKKKPPEEKPKTAKENKAKTKKKKK